jgi:hypothetical protein
VRIRAGALGQDLPATDLVLSRQHRVLVRSRIAQRLFGAAEVLVPAVKLTDLPGIEIVTAPETVEYWHILFDEHHVVFSNGAPTESLFTGREALKAVSPEARDEILLLFPRITDPDFNPELARPIPPKGKHIARLVSCHRKNSKDLLTAA